MRRFAVIFSAALLFLAGCAPEESTTAAAVKETEMVEVVETACTDETEAMEIVDTTAEEEAKLSVSDLLDGNLFVEDIETLAYTVVVSVGGDADDVFVDYVVEYERSAGVEHVFGSVSCIIDGEDSSESFDEYNKDTAIRPEIDGVVVDKSLYGSFTIEEIGSQIVVSGVIDSSELPEFARLRQFNLEDGLMFDCEYIFDMATRTLRSAEVMLREDSTDGLREYNCFLNVDTVITR